MFAEMRAALSIPRTTDILTHLHSLPEPSRSAAANRIEAIERTAMTKQTPSPGLGALLTYLDDRENPLPKAILTRNFDTPVQHFLTHHVRSLSSRPFVPVVTRAFSPPKPRPEGLWFVAGEWGLGSEVEGWRGRGELLPLVMVGDSVDDVEAGWEAGALTVLVRTEGKEGLVADPRVDVVVDRLDDLIPLLEEGLRSKAEA